MEATAMKVGVGCKWFGIWLVCTAAILVYGETAPTIHHPDFSWALMSLLTGVLFYYSGCIWCARAARMLPVRARRRY